MPNNVSSEISVIICTYNTKELTCTCLDKLKDSIDFLGKPVEVIVVENGSDKTGELIREKYKWVDVIKPSENTGFAKGNNLGIRKSGGKSKYYLFLNTDALVKKETLAKAVDFLEQHKDCDVLGCRLVLGDGIVQSSGGYLPTPLSIVSLVWGLNLIPVLNLFTKPIHPKRKSFFAKDRKVGWVMGAFLFMRNEVLDKTKGFDDNFFMYMEEVEWCKRIWDAGFNIWYTPSFSITHLDKASSKGNPEKLRKIFKLEILGAIYLLKKYYPSSVKWVIPLIKIGLHARILAFTIIGDNLRKLAYKETLKEL